MSHVLSVTSTVFIYKVIISIVSVLFLTRPFVSDEEKKLYNPWHQDLIVAMATRGLLQTQRWLPVTVTLSQPVQ
jgi:hypothetical protein